MPCYWRQCSAYRHCRPPVSPISCESTRRQQARETDAGHRADRVAEVEAEAAVAGAAAVEHRDRFGLGWRPELAAAILAHLDRIDLIEVIADDYLDAGRRDLRALRTLAAQVSMVLHGVSLGLASTVSVAPGRLDRVARLSRRPAPRVGRSTWPLSAAGASRSAISLRRRAARHRSREPAETSTARHELSAARRSSKTSPPRSHRRRVNSTRQSG